jgi:ATP-dependent DNA helicase PIF1
MEGQKRIVGYTEEIPNVDISNLVDNQRRIFLRVVEHYRNTQAGENPPPLGINIDGTAGTGKSYLIDALTKALTEMAAERGKKCPILRVAPTGIAVFNIHGATLHQALSIPVRGCPTLNAQQLLLLQGRLNYVKYIILDEKSMIGRRLLSKVDSRFRDGFPQQRDDYFGGCSMLMFGDFGQLPPVGDSPLFDLHQRDGSTDAVLEANHGRDTYLSLRENLTLNRIMRQRGEDDDTRKLREVLEHMHDADSGCFR